MNIVIIFFLTQKYKDIYSKKSANINIFISTKKNSYTHLNIDINIYLIYYSIFTMVHNTILNAISIFPYKVLSLEFTKQKV